MSYAYANANAGAGPVPRDTSFYGSPQAHGARCDICPLAGSTYVPYEAPTKKLKLALVGEGPGRKEIVLRRPFVGVTGEMLNDELVDAGLDRATAHVTNAAMCVGYTDKENERAAECCAPRLLKELASLPADVPIVALGKAAAKAVLGVKSILLARGFVWTARDLTHSIEAAESAVRKAQKTKQKKEALINARLRLDTLNARQLLMGRTVLPTLHPTFAFIHNEVWAPIFHIDLDRVARFVRGDLKLEDLIDRIERVGTLEELTRRTRVFVVTDNTETIDAASRILDREVACDIETERIKPLTPLLAKILTVQLSDGDRSLVIAPWDPKRHVRVLMRFLRGRTVIFHNGFCFDQIAMSRDGVRFEGVDLQDTLTGHHSFASHYPQKLDHVVSTFCDSGPWKVRFGVRGAEEKGLAPQHVEEGELELYGAVDGVVTKHAWRNMQTDLAPERAVYEHDKRRSLLYRDMQVTGYFVDRARQKLLSKLLKRRAAALKGRLRRIARRPHFEPSKLHDVRKVLFGVLRAPMLNPTPTGLAGTSNATLESLRTRDQGDDTKETRVARFSEALLNWRITVKVKSTYCDSIQIHADERAHYNIKPFGVFTGRPASRILSAPRWSRDLVDRIREVYTASPDHLIVYFDLAQAEGRFAANLSNDAAFIEACAVDLHTRNALILFPDEHEKLLRDPKGKYCPRHSEKGNPKAACNCGKPFRDVTKNVGFAIIYQAGPKKVLAYLRSQGFPVDLEQVEDMFRAMRDAYPDYAGYVAQNIRFVEKNGFLRTAIKGRIMWLGFHPEPAAVANLPVQSGIADVMDTRALDEIVPRLRGTGAKLILHHYDALHFDTPKKQIEWLVDEKGKRKPAGKVVEVLEQVWARPVRIEQSIVSRATREFLLPAEIKVAERWSEL
jgi:uracil-DNA glycosylase family 4